MTPEQLETFLAKMASARTLRCIARLKREAYIAEQEKARYDRMKAVAKFIVLRKKTKRKIALMKMGRNAIINDYLLRKVFIPRFETFGLN